ncbi:hypothetical protein L0U85_07075 [Glycomyces sp. L485]|uniref:hypothetical protein n=1 Tax=Glycomyces sp. L485 TaxID=2909235 RepID=UPI001F4AA713|nr:hypothetical protein [Glycomyces sp. L485]MCH7230614.1 hypothetical protein [Glycomyces sp. L485]
MRLTLSVLFMGMLLAIPAVVIADSAFERESQSQAAITGIGTEFLWPDDSRAADPEAALRILSEAAEATGSNVLRTSVGTSESGRKRIAHYVFMGRDGTGLFDEFTLADGRWLSPAESRLGSATVSSARTGEDGNVGVPAVFAGRYELTFAPLSQAYESLPVAGRYAVEAPDAAAADRFLTLVLQRLGEAGLDEISAEDLTPGGAQGSVHGNRGLMVLAYLLAGAAVLVVAFILLREGKRIGVLRLTGHSPMRIWYRVVGRLQIASVLIGLAACAVVALAVPGVDAWFLRALAVAWAEVAVAAFAATMVVGLVIVHRVQIADLIKGSLQ